MNKRILAREWLWFVGSFVVAGLASATYGAIATPRSSDERVLFYEPVKFETEQGSEWVWDGQHHEFPVGATDVQKAEALSLELVGYEANGDPIFGEFLGNSADLAKSLGKHPVGTGYLKIARDKALKNAAARDIPVPDQTSTLYMVTSFASNYALSAVLLGPLLYLGLGLCRITVVAVRAERARRTVID